RAAEEAQGRIRWLRPEFQARREEVLVAVPVGATKKRRPRPAKRPWPRNLPAQVGAVRLALAGRRTPATAAEIAGSFKGARSDRVEEILDTLAALGQVEILADGRYTAE
ncbi:MAG: hypothetical protein AB1543_08665, partial [Candidatus Bipolaricaulota bacterium]